MSKEKGIPCKKHLQTDLSYIKNKLLQEKKSLTCKENAEQGGKNLLSKCHNSK